jgi:hypothetical protein
MLKGVWKSNEKHFFQRDDGQGSELGWILKSRED